MSLFCAIDKSTSGQLAAKVASRQLLSFLYPREIFRPEHRRPDLQSRCDKLFDFPKQADSPPIGEWFLNTLADAGTCRSHLRASSQAHFTSCRRPSIAPGQLHARLPKVSRRSAHTDAPVQPLLPPNTTREELLALVDQYDGESFTDRLPLLKLPNLHQPEPIVLDEPFDAEGPSAESTWPVKDEMKPVINALEDAMKKFAPHISPESLFELYQALPAPRVPYLEAKTRHRFLRNLAIVEVKDEASMLRYLSVVEDMKFAAIPLSLYEWNSAIAFVGRWVAKTTEIEVEAALRMWRDMEHTADIKGNHVTFNILFDLATRAGKFRLAEKIYKEMQKRGLWFNRFHHVSMISYQGLQRNGDGVRLAYKELVESGEIVDSLVLNCVIRALMRCGEPQAAEQVYQRMKRLYAGQDESLLPPREWTKRRKIGRSLVREAHETKRDPKKRAVYQKQSVVAPTLETYRVLIHYYACAAGDLEKAAVLLDEMRWFEVPLHGAIFLSLFKGFSVHGGVRYSAWSPEKLKSVWSAYLRAVDQGAEDVTIGKWIVIWAVQAFHKCSGQSRAIDIWEEIVTKWEPSEEELVMVTAKLRTILVP